jgi:DNA protecting protein DprA
MKQLFGEISMPEQLEQCGNIQKADLIILLRLLSTRGIGPRTVGHILNDWLTHQWMLTDIAGLSATELKARYRLSFESLRRFESNEREAERLLDELSERSIQVLVRGTTSYPPRLWMARGKDAPPILFASGNLSTFQRPAIGFCGSRKASERGLAITSECARIVALSGINVVSGYAHGVDFAAHRAALAAGGTTTVVLAEGILHFRVKSGIREIVNDSNLLVISEFLPRIPWSARQAMTRNRTVCGLSSAMILIESGEFGGTFECGNAALDQRCPLFVVEYASPPDSATGNALFLQRGARALRRSHSGVANLNEVISAATAPSF